jgi:hypothetical protein
MQRLGAEIDKPISFGMIKVDAAPDLWREQLDISAAAHAAGSELHPQIAAPVRHAVRLPRPSRVHPSSTFRRLKANARGSN